MSRRYNSTSTGSRGAISNFRASFSGTFSVFSSGGCGSWRSRGAASDRVRLFQGLLKEVARDYLEGG